MRDLKFRGWHKTKHYMTIPLTLQRIQLEHGRPLEDYEWLQYTGLRDKQGKEIYEGDILRIVCSCGHGENLPVEWRDGHNGYFARAEWQHNWDNNQLELNWTERATEVIGNIYGNPELLNGDR